MKKILALLLIAALMLSVFAGCGQQTTDPTADTTDPTDGTDTTDTPVDTDYEPSYELLPGGVGVNLNENITSIRYDDLELTGAKWARGFVSYFAGDETIAAQVKAFKQLKEAGYNTIVSIKFNYGSMNMPKTQEAYDRVLKDMDKFLDKIYPYADIIVSGNEPFIESLKEERNNVVINFYKAVTEKIHQYAMQQELEVPIFVGAINQLWETTFREDYHEAEFIQWAAETPWVAGIDLHIHHTSMEEFDYMMEYVSDVLRDDQKIIATEFSLVWYWKSNTSGTIPASFAEAYEYDPAWKVHEYIDYAIKNFSQITRQEWEDFLRSCPWYTQVEDYLLDAYQCFMKYEKFYVATYGMYIFANPDKTFNATTDPWVLNPLFASATVQRDEKGNYYPNYKMLENFQLIQEMTNTDDVYLLGGAQLDAVDATTGTTVDEVAALLPASVTLPTNKGVLEVQVTQWTCEEYDSETAGWYVFKATETSLPDTTNNPSNYEITATVRLFKEPKSFSISLPDPTAGEYWFKFDDDAGVKQVVDSVNGETSTVFMAEMATDGVSGGCVSFAGAGSAVQLGKSAANQSYFNSPYTSRTIAFWFNAYQVNGKQMLVEIGGSLAGMAVRINNGVLEAAVACKVGDAGVNTVIGSVTLTAEDVNVWKHVVLSFDQGVCCFYVDGVLIGSETVGATQINAAMNPADIGCNVNGSNAFNDADKLQNFSGKIDDLRFYNSAVVPVLVDNAG